MPNYKANVDGNEVTCCNDCKFCVPFSKPGMPELIKECSNKDKKVHELFLTEAGATVVPVQCPLLIEEQ